MVSAQYLAAARTAHTINSTVIHRNLITGVTTQLPIKDGSVTIDSTAEIRRTLQLTCPPTQQLFDVLDTPGGELTVTKSTRYINRDVETVPLGVFIVDQEQFDYNTDGDLTITAPDRWLKVQRNRFGLSRASVPSNTVWQEIKRLVEGAWPAGGPAFPGWAELEMTATTKVGTISWDDGNRSGAALDLAKGSSRQVFMNANGLGVLRSAPVITPSTADRWRVDAGAQGVMVRASRLRDRSSLRNVIIVSSSAQDIVVTPQEVKNTTAGDPLNVSGPLGYVAGYYASPTIRSTAQARAAGATILSKSLGSAQTITIEAAPMDDLDADQVITVVYPQIDRSTPRAVELHILDRVQTPLMAAGRQVLSTRSTRPDTDGLS